MATTAVQIRARTDQVERHPDPEVPARPRPPRQYSAAYKLRVLAEYERLDKAGKGALLRREGLYTSLISEWRKQRDRGALKALGQDARRGPRPSWCLLRQSWVRPTIMRLAVAEFTYPSGLFALLHHYLLLNPFHPLHTGPCPRCPQVS